MCVASRLCERFDVLIQRRQLRDTCVASRRLIYASKSAAAVDECRPRSTLPVYSSAGRRLYAAACNGCFNSSRSQQSDWDKKA